MQSVFVFFSTVRTTVRIKIYTQCTTTSVVSNKIGLVLFILTKSCLHLTNILPQYLQFAVLHQHGVSILAFHSQYLLRKGVSLQYCQRKPIFLKL